MVGGLLGLLLGAAWVALAASAAPLRVTCAPGVTADVCAETADAGLRRGMPRLHPLVTEAAVAPGPAFPTGYGHRATVRYVLLPGPVVTERLYADVGGHWGVIPDQGDLVLAAWAALPMVLAALVGAGAGGAIGRTRRAAAA